MSAVGTQPLRFDDREEFLLWAEAQGAGRWERHNGVVVVDMAPERVEHSHIKAQAWLALRVAIRKAGVPCQAFIDGPTVAIEGASDFQPDVVVNCGERVPRGVVTVPSPVIVVEVLSPSTAKRDMTVKLQGYFGQPGIQHYLIVSVDERLVIHHRRLDGEGRLLTQIYRDGAITLDPPGVSIAMTDLYENTDLDPASAQPG